jgi:NAD(P)-dependent dehydrogenase (short-subunit alcohol dehydrogenase family)
MSGHRHVAVVTGANGGIGRQIVEALTKQRTAVAACDLDPDVSGLEALGAADIPVLVAKMDLRSEEQCRAGVAAIVQTLGPVDVLVNNAGVMRKKPLEEHTTEEWDDAFAINVRAAFLLCREILPRMAERRSGVVVNVASIWASRGGPERVAYIASKHAMLGLTRALAAEFASAAIRVNAVSPGPVRTPMTEPLGGDQSAWMAPREVAEVVAFLCRDEAAGITGTNVEVPGFGRPAGL